MINRLAWCGRWQQVWQTSRRPTQKIPFSGYITLWSYKLFPCPAAKHNEDSRRARQNALMCVQVHTQACAHVHTKTRADIPSLPLQHNTCTHLSAWWTFIRMQSGGIMWFKQSRGWQTRSPAELKISPNTLRDQIIGPYVDLAQSSHTDTIFQRLFLISLSKAAVGNRKH